MTEERKEVGMEEKEIEVKEENKNYKGAISAPLAFRWDEKNQQWVSRWPDGRVILLHRDDAKNNPPSPNEVYLCTVKFKETASGKGFGIAWLGPPISYPRLIYNPRDTVAPFRIQTAPGEQILEKSFDSAVRTLARRGIKKCMLMFPAVTEALREKPKASK